MQIEGNILKDNNNYSRLNQLITSVMSTNMARKHYCYRGQTQKHLPFWRYNGSNDYVLDYKIQHRYKIALWSQPCRFVYEHIKHLYLSF